MTQRATVDDLKKKKAPERIVTLVLDADVAERWNAATEAKERAEEVIKQFGENPDRSEALDRASDEVERLRPEYEEHAREIVLRGIGRKAYNKLADDHPPTDAQKKEARRLQGANATQRWNPDTFPKALLLASLVEPQLTEEELDELFDADGYNDAELNILMAAALEVNQNSRVLSLGKGSPGTQS